MATWDHTVDLVVVGSGGGAMVAALTAHAAGLSPLVLEKTEYYGGSTALSGGGVWIPNNYLLRRDGVEDSFDKALTYMQATIGDRTPRALQEAYLRNAPAMIEFLRDHTPVRFQRMARYPDYYPERAGGMIGRSLEPVPFDGRKLGDDLATLRPQMLEVPAGLAFTADEFNDLGMIMSTWRGKATAIKVGLRTAWNMATRTQYLTMGRSLSAQLRLALKERQIPLWLNSPVTDLIVEDDRVTGVVVERNGQPLRIAARRGVVLAAGGFARNQALREQYHPQPSSAAWSVANPADTGDAIQIGMAHGAAVDLMDDAWWGPSSVMPDGKPMFHVGERSCPGSIIVDAAGQRYTNESASYVDVVHAMYERQATGAQAIPSFFIMDQRYRSRYIFGTLFPGQPIPQEYYDRGYITRADTLAELADRCGIDAHGLIATVERFNRFARAGRDEDFGRGDSAYDRYYGDPTVTPNPCLAPIETPPFYAVRMYPGDLGTKGGLLTDECARVLRADRTPIAGLYATGNTMASVMGTTYPGPGATIGPSMTFGYVAALHAAGVDKVPPAPPRLEHERRDGKLSAFAAGFAVGAGVGGAILAGRRGRRS